MPFTFRRFAGLELVTPAAILATSTVPAAVPSVESNAVKNIVAPTIVKLAGDELVAVVAMSLSSAVPTAVPSLVQSSWPFVELFAEKNSFPLKLVIELMALLPVPAKISFSMKVPAAVPSVRQSSVPSFKVVAVKPRL